MYKLYETEWKSIINCISHQVTVMQKGYFLLQDTWIMSYSKESGATYVLGRKLFYLIKKCIT